MRRKGLFITVEGVEGAGKSTNIRVIEEFLSEWKLDYILTREPGGTLIAEEIFRKSRRRGRRNVAARRALQTRLKIKLPLVPPNPKELVKTALTAVSLALCGT